MAMLALSVQALARAPAWALNYTRTAVAAGERDQDIAEQLFISISTVRSHLDRIRDKTGRRRRPDLTRLAAERA